MTSGSSPSRPSGSSSTVASHLKDQLQALVQVQEIDSKIDQLKVRLTSHLSELKVFDERIKGVSANLALKEQELSEIERRFLQLQGAKELNDDRLKRVMEREGSANSPKEAEAQEKELAQLKAADQAFTADIVKITMERDALRGSVKHFESEIAEIRNSRAQLESSQSKESSEIQASVQALSRTRTEHTSKVPAVLLSGYDRIRGARGGVGVAPAVAGRCRGCNMMLPPQLFQELTKYRERISCPTCSRILVPSG